MYLSGAIKRFSPRPGKGTLHAGGKVREVSSFGRAMARIRGLWSLLADVEDPALRGELALLATAIQVHFLEATVRERSILEFMAIRFGWPATRTRRRLEALVDLGVLRCSRDLADRWTKVFQVVDRPHVPSAMAVELGA